MNYFSGDMHTFPSVGKRIVEARSAKKFTQRELADRLDISRAAVGQWEIDSTSPSIAKLEEVARILGVEPAWLAYGVTPGQERVVYRTPERDNVAWIPELSFEDELTEKEWGRWGIPMDFLNRELRTSSQDTIISMINSHAVEPNYEYGDKVFIDRSDTKPSPAGVFLYWDGVGAAFGNLSVVPGATPKIRVHHEHQPATEYDLDSMRIIGRVKGRVQRG